MKNNRMHMCIIFVLMSFLIITALFPSTMFASDIGDNYENNTDFAETFDIESAAWGEQVILSETKLPEFVTQAEVRENGHVSRLVGSEDSLNTALFYNSDGTITKYIYS